MRFKSRNLILIFLLLSAFLFSGCETVEPWQKANLADYTMKPDRDPLESSMREHIFYTREAASGGKGVGGGGCGCN